MAKQRTVAVVHTSFVLVEVLNKLFDEIMPGVRRKHIVEHSILQDVMDAGKVTPDVMKRMLGYFELAELTGADLILNACSSVGDTVNVARTFIKTPIIKIDDAMAEEAINTGRRIGVLATVPTTLDPTCRLVQQHADDAGKKIEVTRGLVEGAFQILVSGDAGKHDQMVSEKIIEVSKKVDVIVLAQASMARVIPQLPPSEVKVPVLASPERGIRYLKTVLDGLPA